MAHDLLDRIVDEIRERKQASLAAYEESQRLERALVALEEQRGRTGTPESRRPEHRGGSAAPRRRRRAAPGAIAMQSLRLCETGRA
jgi:hypothetical protein